MTPDEAKQLTSNLIRAMNDYILSVFLSDLSVQELETLVRASWELTRRAQMEIWKREAQHD